MLYSPTIDMVDHRVAVTGSFTDRDELVHVSATMVEAYPTSHDNRRDLPERHGDRRAHARHLHDGGRRRGRGHVRRLSLVSTACHPAEYFAEESLAAALARLAELAPD